MADSTLSNLTSLTLPSQATDLLLVGRGTARPNKVAMSDALNSAALAATTGAYGVVQLAASGGTTAGTVVQATDARLSDTRNPPDGSKGDIVVSGSGSTWTIKTDPTLSGNVTATGWIKTADGTAAAPAYAFTSESGLGFYRAAATGVGFATGGANSLTFYPNGEMYGAQGNNRLALYPTGSIGLIASSSNQTITLTPSGAATAGSLVVSRLTSTNQTLALLNYGSDELMSIVGAGYTGVGSRSNTGFLLYSNNTERARFMAGGNLLIGTTIDAGQKLQVNGTALVSSLAEFKGSTVIDSLPTAAYFGGNKRVSIGYDTTNNWGFVATQDTGLTWQELRLNPYGGMVKVPTGTASTSTISGALVVGNGVDGGIGASGSIWSGGTLTATTGTNSGVLQLNLINNSAGSAASCLFRFNMGTRTASLQAYNDTHATLAGQLRIGTSNGDIVMIPSGVATVQFNASTTALTSNLTVSGDTFLWGPSKTLRINNTTAAVANGTTPINFTRVNNYSNDAVLGAIESVCFDAGTQAALAFKTSPASSIAGGVTAFVLDPAQNARLYGNYFYVGGATSNFHIRCTGSDNGLLRGNFLSADFASGFLLRNDTGTVEYLRVENPSGAVLLGTATNSNNGRLQLADHTAATGGIGMGTDWSFFRLNTSILRFQTASVSPGLSLRHSTSGTELTLTASTASGNGIVNTVSCNNLVLGVNGGTALTLDNAQGATFAAGLRTTAGGFRSTGSLTLGVAYATLGAGFQVSYDSPDTRIFYGDGTGYSLRFATRVSSTTTDRVVINDNGNVTINGNLTVTGTISPSSGAGLTNVWIPASQWIPRTTNGCGVDSTETTTNRQNFDELLFDPAAIEYAQALVRMPSNYNNGTVTARFFWSASSSTGSVVWGLQARAFADDDALDTAFGTAQTVTDTLLATGDMHISAATSAVTSGGTPAATTPIQFQLYRDATNGSDTLGSDARLLGVEISFTSV